jgi:hypothetical protein
MGDLLSMNPGNSSCLGVNDKGGSGGEDFLDRALFRQ